MPRHPLTCIALGWLGFLMLAAHAGASIPDGFGMTVFFVTLWSLGFLFFRACRRWPLVGWFGLAFLGGLFGWQRPVYVHSEISVDDEGNETAVYDCDAANDCSYDSSDDGGGSSERED